MARWWLSFGSLVLFTVDFASDLFLINEYKNDPKLSDNYWALTLPLISAYIITNFAAFIFWVQDNYGNPSARWWCWLIRFVGIILPGHWVNYMEEFICTKCILECGQITELRERKVEIVETVAESAPQIWLQAFIFAVNLRKGRISLEDISLVQIFSSITSILDISYKTFGDLITSADSYECSFSNIHKKLWRPFFVLTRTICFVMGSVSILEYFDYKFFGWQLIAVFVITHYCICAWSVYTWQYDGKGLYGWLQLLFVSLLNVYSPMIITGEGWLNVTNKYTFFVYLLEFIENLILVHIALLLSDFHQDYITASIYALVIYVIGIIILIIRLLKC